MKGRLITNGILSIAIVFFYILFALVMIIFNFNPIALISVGVFIYIFCIISFIMGIVTLSMEKHPSAHGLTITSGILAIFGSVCGINIIISFLAVWKINQSEQNILINEQNEQN